MSVFSSLTSAQLRKAADLKEKISKLEQALENLLGTTVLVKQADGATGLDGRKKRKISAAGIARIKAAQKIRWAKYKQQSAAIPTNGFTKNIVR